MPLNLLKLCVGAESVEDLENWIAQRFRVGGDRLFRGLPYHTTRMVPKRVDPLLEGGSLYWVIKGSVQCRQRLVDIVPFTDGEGIGRCHLVLDQEVVRTDWQPRRPFQGWRYLEVKDAPVDLRAGEGAGAIPPELKRELAGLGLL